MCTTCNANVSQKATKINIFCKFLPIRNQKDAGTKNHKSLEGYSTKIPTDLKFILRRSQDCTQLTHAV